MGGLQGGRGMAKVDFNAGPKRGQRYQRLVHDPTPCNTKISNLYSVEHQVLSHYSSESWRERCGAELSFGKKLESDSAMARVQRKQDTIRMSPPPRAASVELRRTKGLPPVHREKP